MALKDGFPSATGTADALDVRLGLAGLVVRDSSGNPRTGIFPRSTAALVASTATMNSSVGAFEACVSRSAQGVILLPNDGATNVLHDAAPASNKRLDLIWTKQNDAVSPNADSDSLPKFGILKGTASASPTPYTYATAKAALAAGAPGAGAEPLAVVEIPSTATSMQSANVIYTQLHQYTCTTGGMLWFRNSTERDAFSAAEGQLAWLIDVDQVQVYNGSSWSQVGGFFLGSIKRSASTLTLTTALVTHLTDFTADVSKGVTPGAGTLTIVTTGYYDIDGMVQFAANATGARQIFINKNSATYNTNLLATASVTPNASPSTLVARQSGVLLTAGDVLRIFAFQTSGGNLNLDPSIGYLAARYLGA